ncbi:hypothetical protein OSB04_010338 [Centaurea solstitialis]|uniref:PB1 domain-containing protein n=1 Tax=Centaurea solstitialis TaxID=347529 RepID=A0AA38WN14_9ASTR|nr:hypothetical protein OSB04_010338 [Centaurea solstitialis]
MLLPLGRPTKLDLSFIHLLFIINYTDDPQLVQDKIICAFQNLQVDYLFEGLIQFWAPVSGCGRQLLTTSDQPYALATLYNDVGKYRLCCLKYRYSVDVMNNIGVLEEDVGIISDGAAGRAFRNQTPELLPDLKVASPCPLVSPALACGLSCCVMLPVFYPAQSCCIGVVECSTCSSVKFLQVFNQLNSALEKEGLKTFHARDHMPYKVHSLNLELTNILDMCEYFMPMKQTIPGLEHAKNEIDDALKIILHSHGLAYADVWIAYKDENHVSLSSLEYNQTKTVIGIKLTDYYSVILDEEVFKWTDYYLNFYDEDSEWREPQFTDYDNACYRLPLKMGEGLIGKTFQNYEPYFLEDIVELSDDESLLKLVTSFFDCSWFVIYLRSTKTGDLDYLFEFFWRKGQDNVILLESLLLSLERYLPSFKFESGVELGDEIDIIVDVSNSKISENRYIKIFKRNRRSLKRGRQSKVEECSTPSKPRGKTTPIELSREQIESQFGQTQEKAAKKLKVHLSTLKRKCTKLGIKWKGKDFVEENQSETNEEEDNGGAIQDNIREASLDENMVTIKAEYAGEVTMFAQPISSATSKAMEKEIVKRYELDPATRYKLQYLDVENNEWILFTCDENITLFQKDKRNVRLRLLTRDPSHT